MLKNYRFLAKIEDCFRVMKTNFDARPIFVWTPSYINAHFLICFLALVLMRVFEHQIDYEFSPAKIKDALNSAQCKEMTKGYWEVFGNTDFLELNKKLNLNWNKQYVSIEKLRKYGKQFVFTTKKIQDRKRLNP